MRVRPLRVAALVVLTMVLGAVPAFAQQVDGRDVSAQFSALGIEQLRAVEVGGILVLRGRTYEANVAAAAGERARELGYTRVANLVQTVEPADDVTIERMAERELAIHRSLDGCRISVDSNNGVLSVAGLVRHELQKDVAVQLLRSIDGVRSIRSDLRRF